MLEEPQLIVGILGLACFIAGVFVIMQAEQSQLCTRGRVFRVDNATNSQILCDLCKHQCVFNKDDLFGGHLGDIQRKPKDINIRLAEMDEAGGNKKID